MTKALSTFAVSIASTVLCLVLVEGLSRVIKPIQPGVIAKDVDGNAIANDDLYQITHLTPNLHYRMMAQEYDVSVTHNSKGFRGPDVAGDLDAIFLGDSFTFGVGLGDDETIPALFCEAQRWRCANFGYSGSGTVQQVMILRHFLDRYGMRPREVRLLFMGLTSMATSGNDFEDNLSFGRFLESGASPIGAHREVRDILAAHPMQLVKYYLLKYSNLARIAVYIAGPELRRIVHSGDAITDFKEAVEYTRRALLDLSNLSSKNGFRCRVFFISPLSELLNTAQAGTFSLLKRITPKNCSIQSLNPAILETGEPRMYFYSLDGHYNAAGARRVAQYMTSLEGPERQ